MGGSVGVTELTVHIDPGLVLCLANCVGGPTLVQPPVTAVQAGDVEMTDHLSAGAQILPYHQPAR